MKKFLSAVLSAALIFFVTVSMIPTAFAAGSYTITFSAGDKGTLKQALYDSYAASYSVTRTASGNIKIVVPAGSNMPDLPTAADVDLGSNAAKYYVSSGWEPKEAAVTKNATYVVSYGAIVNGVEYTVRYVDAATGNDVDDRDITSSRLSFRISPNEWLDATAMWEHFNEKDHRSRIGKQFCTKDLGPSNVGGLGYSAAAGGLIVAVAPAGPQVPAG